MPDADSTVLVIDDDPNVRDSVGRLLRSLGTDVQLFGSIADFLESELTDKNVDVFLCGIAGRRFTPHYVERIVRALSPQMIVPTHFDDFFRPLDADKRFSFNVNLTGFADEVHTAARQLPLHVLDLGVTCRSSTG